MLLLLVVAVIVVAVAVAAVLSSSLLLSPVVVLIIYQCYLLYQPLFWAFQMFPVVLHQYTPPLFFKEPWWK